MQAYVVMVGYSPFAVFLAEPTVPQKEALRQKLEAEYGASLFDENDMRVEETTLYK